MNAMASGPPFDARAAYYERHADVQRAMAQHLARWAPAAADRAIEFGAGTGLLTRHLRRLGPRLLATDAAPRMVALGRDRVPEVQWALLDAAQPGAAGTYDWIFSSSLAQWLADPGDALARWRALSAPGGHLLAGWFVAGTLDELNRIEPAVAPFRWRAPAEWADILRAAGWRIGKMDTTAVTLHRPTARAVLRELHGLGAVMPARFSTGRLRALLRAYERLHGGPSGVPASFHYLRVLAQNPSPRGSRLPAAP